MQKLTTFSFALASAVLLSGCVEDEYESEPIYSDRPAYHGRAYVEREVIYEQRPRSYYGDRYDSARGPRYYDRGDSYYAYRRHEDRRDDSQEWRNRERHDNHDRNEHHDAEDRGEQRQEAQKRASSKIVGSRQPPTLHGEDRLGKVRRELQKKHSKEHPKDED